MVVSMGWPTIARSNGPIEYGLGPMSSPHYGRVDKLATYGPILRHRFFKDFDTHDAPWLH